MNTEFFKRIISSSLLIPLAIFYIIKGSYFFIFFMSVFFIVTSYEWYKMSKTKIYFLPGIVFLLISSYTAILFRGNNDTEMTLFLFVITICVASDLGGYIFGKLFKGPKLTKVSPNKTYSGMFGSFFLAVIFSNIFFNYIHFLIINETYLFTTVPFVFALMISLVSQLGDLIVSYFKRISKIKNTGNILPGHGGLLDRTDGMIFAIPFAFILFKLL